MLYYNSKSEVTAVRIYNELISYSVNIRLMKRPPHVRTSLQLQTAVCTTELVSIHQCMSWHEFAGWISMTANCTQPMTGNIKITNFITNQSTWPLS